MNFTIPELDQLSLVLTWLMKSFMVDSFGQFVRCFRVQYQCRFVPSSRRISKRFKILLDLEEKRKQRRIERGKILLILEFALKVITPKVA